MTGQRILWPHWEVLQHLTHVAQPQRATRWLAALLSLGGGFLLTIVPSGPILRFPPAVALPVPVLAATLIAVFVAAEVGLLHVELRRHTSSFSFSGAVLLAGILVCDARLVVAARLLAALLVFSAQQLPALKLGYNISSFLLEATLVGVILHAVLGRQKMIVPGSALACLIVVSVVELLMSSLVLIVISWHQAGLSWAQAQTVFLPSMAMAVINILAALSVVVLLTTGAIGVTLIVMVAAVVLLLYRGYLIMHRRHLSLAVVHEFVEQGVTAGPVAELTETLLVRLRGLLNAAQVELIVFGPEGAHIRRVGEDDQSTLTANDARYLSFSSDPVFERTYNTGAGLVIPRSTRQPELRRWLQERQIRDAMIVALPAGESATGGPPAVTGGVILVSNRLGESSTFTQDDLTLLQTLAGHIVVSLRGASLVERLRHDATHDALTGLANRVLFTERIEHALREDAALPTVFLLDLDKFKEVNDALGHHVGDHMLCVVAKRVQACVPADSMVARLGGDEFAIFLPAAEPEEARVLAGALLGALATAIALPEATLSTQASIGIAQGCPGDTGPDLLRHADTAMYAAKNGTESIVQYTYELDLGRAEHLALVADLHVALERDELILHYQPQLDIRTNEIVSVEALVRWEHPTRGLLYPDLFISLAESSGLIQELSAQVLAKALQQCRAWQDLGLDLVVAVNLSAHNLKNEALPNEVAVALAAVGLPSSRLVLEITESVVMDDQARSIPILQGLADIGVTLSLDDFGTGFSSLAYLQQLPVNELKIDKSFVRSLAPGANSHASTVLLRTVITLADNLGLRVVAEGVETAFALDRLREMGADLAQGYHIARPQPPLALARLVTQLAAKPLEVGQRLA